MPNMQDMHLASLDLNLIVALDALLAERSVTKAAERIGITQSAMSHALARLRLVTQDQLLVRAAGGMVPTPRALAQFGERWKPYRSVAAWYLWRAVELSRSGQLAKCARPPRIAQMKRKRRAKARVRRD